MRISFIILLPICAGLGWAEATALDTHNEFIQTTVRKIQNQIAIADLIHARQEAEQAIAQFPTEAILQASYLNVLCALKAQTEVLKQWEQHQALFQEASLFETTLESVAWSILSSAGDSPSAPIQEWALIGLTSTSDAFSVQAILQALGSPLNNLRLIAAQLAASFPDWEIQEALLANLKKEKSIQIRLAMIQSLARSKATQAIPYLAERLRQDNLSRTERMTVMRALVNLQQYCSEQSLLELLDSRSAAMREWGIRLCSCLKKLNVVLLEKLVSLFQDPLPGVRLALLTQTPFLETIVKDSPLSDRWKSGIEQCLSDNNSMIAICGAWANTLWELDSNATALVRWLESQNSTDARIATGALASLGSLGTKLAKKQLYHQDPYVRSNAAIALLQERISVEEASHTLLEALEEAQENLWEWDEESCPFSFLRPSQQRHHPAVPNLPAYIDQQTRIHLISLLSTIGCKTAKEKLKLFIKELPLEQSAIAMWLLLTQGDNHDLSLLLSLLDDPDEPLRVQAALILAIISQDQRALEPLKKAYASADRRYKDLIVYAIGKVGNREAISFLVQVLQEPFQGIRMAAAANIVRCLYQ